MTIIYFDGVYWGSDPRKPSDILADFSRYRCVALKPIAGTHDIAINLTHKAVTKTSNLCNSLFLKG